MPSKTCPLVEQLSAAPKKMFIIDSIGALLTAFFLGIVLPGFEARFGMPRTACYSLAAIAGCYAVYSGYCAVFPIANRKPYLRAIMLANLLYGLLTLSLVLYWRSQLSTLAFFYFLAELCVMVPLIGLEYKLLVRKS